MTREGTIIACSILAVLVWTVFGNCLANGFVWDDLAFTAGNPVYRDFDIVRIFTTLANGLEYLPVRDVSYAIDHAIGHGRPAVFHLSNLLIYTFTVLIVFGYARTSYRLIRPEKTEGEDRNSFIVGFITASLFAVHPIHCEVVNFITCRNALLSTLLFFVAGFLFLQAVSVCKSAKRRTIAYLAALFLFLLSIFSKANSIILPMILILHILYLRKERWIRLAGSTLPFFAISICSFFLMTTIANDATLIADKMGDWTLNGCITKIVVALQIALFYLRKLVFPYGFSAAYETAFAWSPAAPAAFVTFIGLILLLFMAFRLRKNQPYLLFGLCWYLLTLIPVFNFFKTTPVVADRYAFLPSFAFFFVVASAGVHISEKIKPKIPIIISIVLVTCWSTIAAFHNKVWFSDETLWADTIRVSPKNIRANRNMGNIYLTKHDYNKAISYFAPIADEDPCYYYVLGYLAFEKGDMSEARQNLVKSLGRDVNFIAALFYLGMVYEKTGQTDMAAELFKQARKSHELDWGGFKVQAEEHLERIRAIAVPAGKP